MTQRDRVLHLLREAGEKGIRSDHFFKLGMPRAAARIGELKAEGHEIETSNEHPFVRYRLLGADVPRQGRVVRDDPRSGDARFSSPAGGHESLKLDATHSDPSHRAASKAGVEQAPLTLLPEESVPPATSSTPSMYDPHSEAA